MRSRGHFSNAGRSPPFPPSAVDVGVRVRGAFPPNAVLRCFPPRPPEGAGGPRARSVACSLTPSFLSHVPSGCPFPVCFFFCVCVLLLFVVFVCFPLASLLFLTRVQGASGPIHPHSQGSQHASWTLLHTAGRPRCLPGALQRVVPNVTKLFLSPVGFSAMFPTPSPLLAPVTWGRHSGLHLGTSTQQPHHEHS